MSQTELEIVDVPDRRSKDGKEDYYIETKLHAYKINLTGAIAIIVGTIIGSGIFATPTVVIKTSGSVGMALIIWVFSGVMSTCMALSFAELGAMIPKSGGEYIYLKEGFGDLMAFICIFVNCVVILPGTQTLSCIVFAEYIIKAVAGSICDMQIEAYIVKMLAAFVLGFATLINMWSTKWATSVQILFTIAKLLAIAMLIITGLYTLARGQYGNFANAFDGTSSSVSDIAYALNGGLYAYGGWNNLNYVVEEVKNPKKNLPMAILISMVIVTLCYVMVNIAYISALSQDEIRSSNAVAWTLAKDMYGPMAWTIPFFVSCSIFGSVNGGTLVKAWCYFSASREGQLPTYLSMVQLERQTPLPALLTMLILSWVMLAPNASTFESLLHYVNLIAYLFYGLAIIALLWLRYKRPDAPRPYKVHIIIPIVASISSMFLVFAPFKDYPLESFYSILFALIGIPLYFLLFKLNLPNQCFRINGWINRMTALLLDVDIDNNRLQKKS